MFDTPMNQEFGQHSPFTDRPKPPGAVNVGAAEPMMGGGGTPQVGQDATLFGWRNPATMRKLGDPHGAPQQPQGAPINPLMDAIGGGLPPGQNPMMSPAQGGLGAPAATPSAPTRQPGQSFHDWFHQQAQGGLTQDSLRQMAPALQAAGSRLTPGNKTDGAQSKVFDPDTGQWVRVLNGASGETWVPQGNEMPQMPNGGYTGLGNISLGMDRTGSNNPLLQAIINQGLRGAQ